MPFKTIEERRAYAREYLRKKYANDPEYRAACKQRVIERSKAGYFKNYQRKNRENPEVKAAQAEYMRARRAADPQKHREIDKRCKEKLRRDNPKHFRDKWLKHAYGMSLEEYEQRLVTQGGNCAFCPTPHSEKKPLVVDHDHRKPRGQGNRWLLCNQCNVMIGAAQERPEVLMRAAQLLGKYFGDS